MGKVEINESFWFSSNQKSDISQLKEGLNSYINCFEKASNLEEYPIFLDTNVLLFFYKVSNKVKKNFIDFLEKNRGNIYITEHIQEEFLKSRVRVINNDYINVLKDVPNDLKSNVNKISSFINSNKTLLNDYSDIYSELQDVESNLLSICNKLDSEINKDLKKNKNIKYNDPLLDAYSNISVISNISIEEKKFIKDNFFLLKKQNEIIYPGMMDGKNKDANGDGDFIVFHEVMKYMKENDTNVIFLTNDIKEDWFEIDSKKNRHPQISYIDITYKNTGKFNFILEANRTLSDLLDVKISSNTYQKVWAKQNKLLKEKTFNYSWVDDIFRDILNNRYLDDFSHPVSDIEIEYGVDLSNIDFDVLLEDSQSFAEFSGEGVASSISVGENNNEVTLQIRFYFHGSCVFYLDDKSIEIDTLTIDEQDTEVV